MKSLSCFCDLDVCRHFTLATLDYFEMTNPKHALHIEGIYGLTSDSDNESLAVLKNPINIQNIEIENESKLQRLGKNHGVMAIL